MAEEEQKETTLREDLAAVAAQVHADAQEQADAVTEEPAPEAEAAPEAADDKTPAPDPEAEAAEAPEAADAGETPTESADGDLIAPEHWGAEITDKFNALPDEAKQVALDMGKRMEARHREKGQELAEQRKQLEPMNELGELFAPHQQQLAAHGLTPGQYVQRMMATAAGLQANPREMLLRLAQQYGVDPSALVGQVPEDDVYVDPATAKLQGELSEIKAVLVGQAQQQQQGIEQTRADQVAEIEKFAQAEDPQGNRLYPHFETVRGVVATHSATQAIGAGATAEQMQAALKTAYQDAVWSIPEARTELMRQEEARQTKETKAKADKANKARTVVRTNASPTAADVADQKDMTTRQALKQVADQMREQSQRI